ncbi:hypothetical protein PTE_01717 [Photorhabdus khanii NC19]|uniref:Permease n=1 Tax=Photorhabdus khanii NC19 TaxID=1004151 RepID=W3V7P1_9GAMM|nr:hypothetical protein [Photorhabdus khanii]ETS31961.1 hypothetical protein PTE_01717 [Photorhabdus khanii NC19]
MKHVLNIALMAIVVLGLAMLEATNWGYAVLAIPAVVWIKPVLNLLHKQPVLAIVFWVLVAVFAWQAALAGILFYGVLATPKAQAPAKTNGKKSRKANLMGTYSYDYQTGECFS